MGWILDSIKFVYDVATSVVKNNYNYKKTLKGYANSYKSALTEANKQINEAKSTYNQAKDEITTYYGSEVFSLLEQQYNAINSISGNAITTNSLKSYNPEKNADGETIEVTDLGWGDSNVNLYGTLNNGNVGNYEDHVFNTKAIERQTGFESFIDQMYNSLASGDTALAQQLRLSGNQLANILGVAQDNISQSLQTGMKSIEQSAMQLHSQNLSNALEIASARSAMASSGIRNTGTGNANESLTKLQADITRAYYAININAQAMQLQNEIYNSQKTASLSAYETRASIENKQRQEYENVVSKYGSYTKKAEGYVSEANNYEEQANEYAEAARETNRISDIERMAGLF